MLVVFNTKIPHEQIVQCVSMAHAIDVLRGMSVKCIFTLPHVVLSKIWSRDVDSCLDMPLPLQPIGSRVIPAPKFRPSLVSAVGIRKFRLTYVIYLEVFPSTYCETTTCITMLWYLREKQYMRKSPSIITNLISEQACERKFD